ncbi:MAG: methionine--tRNA ligase [Candidatus Daviesbacteria bacterium]|nr:methionine--tRNA ligase [Candidatus Daviesbacteria bacterium]
MNKYYITTAIPYVNAAPHIGFALETIQADAIARYHRLLGEDVYFSSGSDENSLKNVQAAEAENIPTQQLVDKYAKKFQDLKEILNLSYDIFNRTATKNHFKGAQKLWISCKKEDLYKKTYTGLYCVGCEEFYTEEELVERHCPEHPNIIPDQVSEENYFFKLTNYQTQLEELITSSKLDIIPETRKNEVLSFIKQGLKDFSISRSKERAKNWGVPVPGDESQVMYVWFDALVTYLTALGYGNNEELFNKYWTKDTQKIHVIGKGIIRFHAVYWIAMLLSVNFPLPNTEFVHGYITVNGQKISKSLGNVIDPFQLVEKYGTDALRYYLLREIPAYGDGDFSEEKFKELYNADLANGLGNLISRIAKLCEQNNIEAFPGSSVWCADLEKYMKEFKFNEAIAVIWQLITETDKKINEEKPWQLKGGKLKKILEDYIKRIQAIAFNLRPFLPETAQKIEKQFSGKIKSGPPLFPRIT